jgi:starch synthase
MDPQVSPVWIRSGDLRAFARIGAMHLADPSLAHEARVRLRAGSAAYSITGLTHTISSASAMKMLAEIPIAPIMPWDGLICTSQAVKSSVESVFAHQEEYLRWKFKSVAAPQRPQLPVIPLGVHCADFSFSQGEQTKARRELGIGADEVAFLFLGRLSFHAKAHPYQMYRALEAAAAKTGKKIVLIQCGWFGSSFIEEAFRDGALKHCPSVRCLWLDGRNEGHRANAWAASDVFISLSDNIQETFGLALIEAMAASKPVIATDWDGYRDIVVHGETGFLVRTFMPGP